MKRLFALCLLVFCFLSIGMTTAFASSAGYSSYMDDPSGGYSVWGHSETYWEDQGIFADGAVTGTLHIYRDGKWQVASSESDSQSGNSNTASVMLSGYSSGYYYYESGSHTGDFWSSTKYSTSGTVRCP